MFVLFSVVFLSSNFNVLEQLDQWTFLFPLFSLLSFGWLTLTFGSRVCASFQTPKKRFLHCKTKYQAKKKRFRILHRIGIESFWFRQVETSFLCCVLYLVVRGEWVCVKRETETRIQCAGECECSFLCCVLFFIDKWHLLLSST